MDSPHPLTGQSFHLLGISGRGLAPLSVIARHLGAEGSGYDRAGAPENDRVTAVLEPFSPGHAHWAHKYAAALNAADRVVVLPGGHNSFYRDGRDIGMDWLARCRAEKHVVGGHDDAVETGLRLSAPGDVPVFCALASGSAVMAHQAAGTAR